MPFFTYEVVQDQSIFSADQMIIIASATILSVAGQISMAYAFKHGIAGRVQAIATAQIFVLLILHRAFADKGSQIEFLRGIGVALAITSAACLYKQEPKKQLAPGPLGDKAYMIW